MSTEREPGAVSTMMTNEPGKAVADAPEAIGEPKRLGATAITPHQPNERDAVVIVGLPPGATAPEASKVRSSGARQCDNIHIAANLRKLVAATPLATPQEDMLAKERRDLNEVVHSVLIIGLFVSTALMLVGVGLALFYQRDLPTAVPHVGDVIGRVLTLRPSGFLALGLIMLIATPILRVVGSIGAFLYERDWRYAAITSLVLGILVASLMLGRG
jgi:uncharacterized membrane protein